MQIETPVERPMDWMTNSGIDPIAGVVGVFACGFVAFLTLYATQPMYRNYFPLLALAECYKSHAKAGSMVAEIYFTAASSSTR